MKPLNIGDKIRVQLLIYQAGYFPPKAEPEPPAASTNEAHQRATKVRVERSHEDLQSIARRVGTKWCPLDIMICGLVYKPSLQ